MKKVGKGSSADIAAASSLHERFVREWLHQQVCHSSYMAHAAEKRVIIAGLNVNSGIVNADGTSPCPLPQRIAYRFATPSTLGSCG